MTSLEFGLTCGLVAAAVLALTYGIGWGWTGCHRWFLPCTCRTPQGGTVFAGLRREPPEYLPGPADGLPIDQTPVRAGELHDNYATWVDPETFDRLDADVAADVLIAEWHDETNERWTGDWLAVDLDDPDAIVWDAKQQAARCWEILHVEFPRLRAELAAA